MGSTGEPQALDFYTESPNLKTSPRDQLQEWNSLHPQEQGWGGACADSAPLPPCGHSCLAGGSPEWGSWASWEHGRSHISHIFRPKAPGGWKCSHHGTSQFHKGVSGQETEPTFGAFASLRARTRSPWAAMPLNSCSGEASSWLSGSSAILRAELPRWGPSTGCEVRSGPSQDDAVGDSEGDRGEWTGAVRYGTGNAEGDTDTRQAETGG